VEGSFAEVRPEGSGEAVSYGIGLGGSIDSCLDGLLCLVEEGAPERYGYFDDLGVILVGVRLEFNALGSVCVVKGGPFVVVGSAETDFRLGTTPSWVAP
jgi:hypothetical protein